jgi:hypothetical protein
MEKKRLTLKKVNSELKSLGLSVELVQGRGYFYFSGEDVLTCRMETGVYGAGQQLNNLTLDQWIEEARERAEDAKANQ